MLNKVKIAMAVGIGLKFATYFFPDLPMPEGTQESLTDVIVLGAMWFSFWKVRETKASVEKLVLKD